MRFAGVLIGCLIAVTATAGCTPSSRDAPPGRTPSEAKAQAEEPTFGLLEEVKGSYRAALPRKTNKRCLKRALKGVTPAPNSRLLELQGDHPIGGHTYDIGWIAGAIERLRGLRFKQLPAIAFMTSKELSARFDRSVDSRYSEARFLAREDILRMIGAVGPNDDLRSANVYWQGRDIRGFYDPRAKRVFTPYQGPGLELTDRQREVLAHELVHALADQRLPDPKPKKEGFTDVDAALASAAVQEGDAMFVQNLFRAAALDRAPFIYERLKFRKRDRPYLVRQVSFPYIDGYSFACQMFVRNGWKGVDRLYRDPPTTTAEILWPRRYLKGVDPAEPRGFLTSVEGWEVREEASFGALDLIGLFEAPGARKKDRIAPLKKIGAVVEDWNGGRLALFRDPRDVSAIAIGLETRRPGSALCDALGRWAKALVFGEERATKGTEAFVLAALDRAAVITCDGTEIRVGLAPDVATARAFTR
ncbi:MAG: hypothetical protein GEU78_00360 [Actinobacteria bacterium]|nr:hypothetical protein [Actinomycetota bacterium]